ncbi:MAG: GNAT family N-acetyltransferase [Actinomycetota bacterium]|nr:GNAT family N-acetyltransferase [Actinomycetota bacterium]
MRWQLRPADAACAETVATWATTGREVALWCGHPDAPVPVAVIRDWAREPGVQAFGLYDDGRLTAYGELWVDDDEQEVELARLIVDPAGRGRGVGRVLATRLAGRARTSYADVFLRVHPDNVAAWRAYAAAGFEPVPEVSAAEWNAGQPVPYRWLAHRDPPPALRTRIDC